MDNSIKGSKTIYLVLAAGIGIGSLSTAAIVVNRSGSGQSSVFGRQDGRAMPVVNLTGETLSGLKALDASFTNLAEFAAPAVVDIKSTSGRAMTNDGRMSPARGGEGSGFIYRKDGYIITNDHVVGGYDTVTVTLKDGREFKGKVYRAEDFDLAVVKIEANDLPTLALSDSNKVKPGQLCMAVGAPFGFENSVAFGHISALNRDRTMIGNRYYSDLIQTDTPINQGNSGGPLIDVEGRVVGVNTLIYSPSGTSAGLGFAIPSNQVRMIADSLVKNGKVTRAMIGFAPQNLKEYELAKLKIDGGARVETLSPGGPAEKAGLKVGDIITRVADTPVKNQVDLRSAMLVYPAGRTVAVEYLRDGQRKTAQVKLEEYQRPRELTQPKTGQDGDGGLDLEDLFKNLPNRGQAIPDFPRRRNNNSDTTPETKRTGSARLGVSIVDAGSADAKTFGIPSSVKGAVVMVVEPGSVAESLGLKVGDVITNFDGKSISTASELTEAMKGTKWGDRKRISYGRYSGNSQSTVTMDIEFR